MRREGPGLLLEVDWIDATPLGGEPELLRGTTRRRGLCLDTSADVPLDAEFPPAICTKPAGHDGMHSDGRCAWEHLI